MEISSTSRFPFKPEAQLKAEGRPNCAAGLAKTPVANNALLLTEALRSAQNAPDVRSEKVAELRAKIEAGTYKIDAAQIAMALIRDDLNSISW